MKRFLSILLGILLNIVVFVVETVICTLIAAIPYLFFCLGTEFDFSWWVALSIGCSMEIILVLVNQIRKR